MKDDTINAKYNEWKLLETSRMHLVYRGENPGVFVIRCASDCDRMKCVFVCIRSEFAYDIKNEER